MTTQLSALSRWESQLLVEAFADCAFACTELAETCVLREPGLAGDCIRLSQTCAHVCDVASRLLAREDRSRAALALALDTCSAACFECADECDDHPEIPQCRGCAGACRRCATTCDALLKYRRSAYS